MGGSAMNRTAIVAAASLISAALPAASAPPKAPAMRVGACAFTHVKRVETRLVDGTKPVPDSGSAVLFQNGLYQVSYDRIPAVEHSRVGDPVFICLMKLPHNCPPGDDRGKLYTTTNLRTESSWTL